MPGNDMIRWKDLRSGMACHLLKQGWTTDEVNFRLGHKPSSREIDVYVSYLAVDRRKPKKKVYDSSLHKIQLELEASRSRERLAAERFRRHAEDSRLMKSELDRTRRDLEAIEQTVQQVLSKLRAA